MTDKRTYWYAPDLSIEDEPLAVSLIKYRQKKNRWEVSEEDANLVSSLDTSGKHRPIFDLDFPHHFEPSSTPGHSHLFIDIPMTRFKLMVLTVVLYWCGVIELGHMVWTLRRGASFVRKPGVAKTAREDTKPTYGWFFKLKG